MLIKKFGGTVQLTCLIWPQMIENGDKIGDSEEIKA